MEERNIALVEPGSSEVYFRAWGERAVGAENTIVWSNNSDLLNKLRAVCRDGQCCIKTLFEGRRYFHMHAHQCGISRALP